MQKKIKTFEHPREYYIVAIILFLLAKIGKYTGIEKCFFSNSEKVKEKKNDTYLMFQTSRNFIQHRFPHFIKQLFFMQNH